MDSQISYNGYSSSLEESFRDLAFVTDMIPTMDEIGGQSSQVSSRAGRMRDFLNKIMTSNLTPFSNTSSKSKSTTKNSGSISKTLDALGEHAYDQLTGGNLPTRARSDIKTIARLRPMMSEYDIERLKKHRRDVRKARRRMCFFWLYPRIPKQPTAVLTLTESNTPTLVTGNTKDTQLSFLPSPMDLTSVKETWGTQVPKCLTTSNSEGNYLHVDGLTTPVRAGLLESGLTRRPKVKLPVLNLHAPEKKPVVDSYRVLLTHMSASVGHSGSTRSGYKAADSIFNPGKNSLMSPIIEMSPQGYEESTKSTALVKYKGGLSADAVKFKPMLSFEYAGHAFNQRLVAILWYLFEEYMMYPSKSYHSKGYAQHNTQEFKKVNHAFWEYVGALLNTLAHREWLFDYLGAILEEFPKLVTWNDHGKMDALRAVRTSCYLICKLFDSKHEQIEVEKFYSAQKSCFRRLLGLSMEETGMGPTSRLALTFIFSHVRVTLQMVEELVNVREQDNDYFRVHRIPLRCFMMVWMKLILLQDDEGTTGTEMEVEMVSEEREEIRRIVELEVRTVIALEHNTTIRTLYFQLYPDLNTK